MRIENLSLQAPLVLEMGLPEVVQALPGLHCALGCPKWSLRKPAGCAGRCARPSPWERAARAL